MAWEGSPRLAHTRAFPKRPLSQDPVPGGPTGPSICRALPRGLSIGGDRGHGRVSREGRLQQPREPQSNVPRHPGQASAQRAHGASHGRTDTAVYLETPSHARILQAPVYTRFQYPGCSPAERPHLPQLFFLCLLHTPAAPQTGKRPWDSFCNTGKHWPQRRFCYRSLFAFMVNLAPLGLNLPVCINFLMLWN